MKKINELQAEEKSVLTKMFWNSHKVFHNFNMTKMEANGFTMTMSPAIESIYKDDPEAKKEAYVRHQAFFNTHAVAMNYIAGMAYALEKDYYAGKIPESTINAVKVSLMGPTAGMFDSLFFNCLRVIAAGVGIGLCASGNIIGSILFILIYGVTQSVCKYYLTVLGYTSGTEFIDKVYNSGLMSIATRCVSILGLLMVGAMLFLYARRIVKVGKKFRTVVTATFITMILGGLLTTILYMIPFTRALISPILTFMGNPLIGLGLTIVYLIVACLFLLVDFSVIEECIERGISSRFEWMAAFGLTYTIIYIYFRVLDLILRVVSIMEKK